MSGGARPGLPAAGGGPEPEEEEEEELRYGSFVPPWCSGGSGSKGATRPPLLAAAAAALWPSLPPAPCPLPARFSRLPVLPWRSVGEEAAGAAAFEREYADDHSWEELQEDEHGNLRPLVRRSAREGAQREQQQQQREQGV